MLYVKVRTGLISGWDILDVVVQMLKIGGEKFFCIFGSSYKSHGKCDT